MEINEGMSRSGFGNGCNRCGGEIQYNPINPSNFKKPTILDQDIEDLKAEAYADAQPIGKCKNCGTEVYHR
jgi:hypothetical protein